MAVDEKKVAESLAWIAKGGAARERGVTMLDDLMGGLLERYFMRNKVRPEDAEEMVWEVWMKICSAEFRGETRAVVWVWIIARNALISYHRARHPDINLDDDDWESVLNDVPATQAPAWLTLCIERALHRFSQDYPERSEILRMVVEEWSTKEIGAYLGCSEGAARDRLYRTRQKVEPYLEECRSADVS
jgi:RNA polymerase sigma factor (sigma-70 family)